MNIKSQQAKTQLLLILSLLFWPIYSVHAALSQQPLFLTSSVPPLVMLTMDRSHKLYYEAYNDASDLNGDGLIDVGYKPSIEYFGYFDSHRCYDYNSSTGIFEPKDATLDKKCSSVDGAWSGDFLNYLTTARIDALRKVLYGGYRSVDTTTSTVLKRSFIPQDAHAWGKEYNPATSPGYLIEDYAPLSQPVTGRSHLFANVSLSYAGQPLLRVLNDSPYRIWEWVSIERPVAGSLCLNGSSGPNCVIPGVPGKWETVPSTVFSQLVRTVYDLTVSGPSSGSNPSNHSDFNNWISNYAKTKNCFGYTSSNKNCNKSQGSMSQMNGNDNNPYDNNFPYSNTNDNYMTVVKGKINISTAGNYQFSVDGDDAVEVIIDGTTVAGFYGGHGVCGCNDHNGTINLTVGSHDIEYRHEERTGGDSWTLRWYISPVVGSDMTDYNVKVQACVVGKLEANCKAYTDASNNITYKPKGLLQDYGENDSMAFGLITGSYAKNISGGVLRKNIESFKNEVDPNTGIFTNINGIVSAINKLQIITFDYSCPYCYKSGWITDRPINEGEAQEWGNPIAEMMYEGLRYFAGKASPTSAFSISASATPDATLELPLPNWLDPYGAKPSGGGFLSCAKPLQMVISDINPSYDTDQLPGSYFNSFTGDLAGLDVSTLADQIWQHESEASKVFIGQSGSVKDGAPTPKSASSFKDIRGLSPEEPTKMGGYYAASVALHGARNDLNVEAGKTGTTDYQKDQKANTLAVALASPLPRIEIPIKTLTATKTITLVPFAKSVAGGGISATSTFQPTNQIVDFYVEKIANTTVANYDGSVNGGLPYGKFRINYEDVEQAADHDMDAIVEYTFSVNSSGQLTVSLNSAYAAGGIVQHMGYVISGTTADGVYLEVRDLDTTAGTDVDYFLDTPPGVNPGGAWKDKADLPLTTSRIFNLGSTTSASFIKHDPLWYAAKWGVQEKHNNDILEVDEWDGDDGNGIPDNYFLVTNAGKLSEQLGKAFFKILDSTSSASAVAANSTRLDNGTLLYQAKFDPRDWSGQLLALKVDLDTKLVITDKPVWEAASLLPDAASRKIYTSNPAAAAGSRLVEFKWDTPTVATVPTLTATQQGYLNQLGGTPDTLGPDRLNWLRGDSSKEKRFSSGIFRNRVKLFNETFITDSAQLQDATIKTNKLGDIVNSDPIYVGTDDLGYGATSTGLTSAEITGYQTFRTGDAYKNRTPMIYVGANEGMLHGFDATTTGGTEKFAYVPNALFPELSKLASPNYTHKYFVDGVTATGDVFFNSSWHTILAGTTGAGGKAIYALDVTDPSAIGPASALWEFTGADATYGADLGYTLAEPTIARMHNGKWAVILANGYESTNGSAVLFILDAQTGAVIQRIETGAVGSNGLSSPTVVDSNGDKVIDAIYAGDLKGNLWKFDVSSTTPGTVTTGATPVVATTSNWGVANSGKPLFVACTTTGTNCAIANRQPITGKPTVGKVGSDQGTGQMVYFGTGKYFETTDNVVGSTPQTQTFYGLWDDNTNVIDDRAKLQEQSIIFEGAATSAAGSTSVVKEGLIRVTSRTTVCYSATQVALIDDDTPVITCDSTNLKKGWAMNLLRPDKIGEGERVVTRPVLFNNLVIFSTVIPSTDPCKGGGKSRAMLVEAITGKRPSTSPFDIFGGSSSSPTTKADGIVNATDMVKVDGKTVAATGIDIEIDVHKQLTIVGNLGCASGSSGGVGCVVLEEGSGGGGGGGAGGKRTSWRQLR